MLPPIGTMKPRVASVGTREGDNRISVWGQSWGSEPGVRAGGQSPGSEPGVRARGHFHAIGAIEWQRVLHRRLQR